MAGFRSVRMAAFVGIPILSSHGENRGSSPLGSAIRVLIILIFLLFC
jgi:hypothetical protein